MKTLPQVSILNKFLLKWVPGLLLVLITCDPSNTNGQDSSFIINWLSPGTLPITQPVFHDKPGTFKNTFEDADLLELNDIPLNTWWPEGGDAFLWPGLDNTKWKAYKAQRDGYVEIRTKGQEKLPRTLGIALAYLTAESFTKISIKFKSNHAIQVYLDGKESGKSISKQQEENLFIATASFTLEPGCHVIVVKSLSSKEASNAAWKLQACYSYPKERHTDLQNPIKPSRVKDLAFLLEGPRVTAVTPSHQGAYFLIELEETHPVTGHREEWIELWDIARSARLFNFRGTNIRQAAWSPQHQVLLYRTREKDLTKVWIMQMNDLSLKLALSEKDLGQVYWSPDGRSLIYTKTEQAKESNSGVRRISHMLERWPWWKRRAFLNQIDLNSMVSRRLTWGNESIQLLDIHPNSHTLLISSTKPDFSERPFSRQTVMSLDVNKMQADTLFTTPFSLTANYSPDGSQLLLTGSPMLFGGLGSVVPEGVVPNDYDTQAYLHDLATNKTTSITREFNPSINQALWSKFDGKIYFLVTDKTYKRIYSYDPRDDLFDTIITEVDVVTQMAISSDSPWIGFTGSSISSPPRAYLYNASSGEKRIVSDPEEENMKNMHFGDHFDWDFEMPDGTNIEGRVYLPPHFDKAKKYPVLVHYYGGTSPVDRSFRGRYPKNLFAAHGYITYVLQPSGATGYGQAFSARHVNNWGQTVTNEIITGTKTFLKAHSYADSTRVGCIGASYGGFMTMLLLSETNIFKTGIAHAGISSISSYWGEGFWGYLYSATASADSYPWNNPELYVGQSPLFRADKISSPLLLLHGKDDDNVPPGESIQLFTALKLLEKEVELIEIEGQGHHVMDYSKRSQWQKTILAWLAKHLQDKPEWWEELYPSP